MTSHDLSRWMWSEAVSLVEQADRLQRQFVRPAQAVAVAWEPPVDVVETAQSVRVCVALPGAQPDSVAVVLESGAIAISARRPFPLTVLESEQGARIRALEIPHGRFERRIALPVQALDLVGKSLQDGCLTLTFKRKDMP
ncbi:MAG: Hsp20/alpha crystallin family protein [Burkholderiales bacterium]